MDLGLKDKVFIVTGGTSGLGFATAKVLLAEGARVVVSGRSPERGERSLAGLGAPADRAVFLAADNADEEAPNSLVATTISRWGRLDGALISVGGPKPSLALETNDEDWRLGFETVFLGATRLVRTFAPRLEEGGALAIVLSVSAKAPLSGLALSNGFRPGLAMLTKSFADELAPTCKRINSLLPGPFATERATRLTAAGHPPDVSTIPLGRLGDPLEFGRVAAFLLSPAASFITGTAITVDGGASRIP